MKNKLLFFVGTIILLSTASCIRDTCNGAIGNTFRSIEFDSIYTNDLSLLEVGLSLDVNPSLPSSYFSDLTVFDKETEEEINSILMNTTNMTFGFSNFILPDSAESNTITSLYFFGDRRDYVDCVHPGSDDVYFLEITFELHNINGSQFEISDFEWLEWFVAGHL